MPRSAWAVWSPSSRFSTRSAPKVAASSAATSVRPLSTPKSAGLASSASTVDSAPATTSAVPAVRPAPSQLPTRTFCQLTDGSVGALGPAGRCAPGGGGRTGGAAGGAVGAAAIGAVGGGPAGGVVVGVAATAVGRPQLPQKRLVPGLSEPQWAHVSIGVPRQVV